MLAQPERRDAGAGKGSPLPDHPMISLGAAIGITPAGVSPLVTRTASTSAAPVLLTVVAMYILACCVVSIVCVGGSAARSRSWYRCSRAANAGRCHVPSRRPRWSEAGAGIAPVGRAG